MGINIPSSVFDVYNEAILLFTRSAKLVYPEKGGLPKLYYEHNGNK